MKKKRVVRLSLVCLSLLSGGVLCSNVWALEADSTKSMQPPVPILVKGEKVHADLHVANGLVFEGESDVRELAFLSENEIKETKGAVYRYFFDPAGWRYWNVRLANEYRNSPSGGCSVSAVCIRIGGWHIWREGQQGM